MPTPFSRTLRALHEDAPRRTGVLVVLLLLLAAWVTWAFAGTISVLAVSRRARFESARTVRQIASPASGRIAAVNIALGRSVRAGDVLVELDASEPSIRRSTAEATIATLRRRVVAISAQIEATRVGATAQQRSAESKLRAANESRQEAAHLAGIEDAKADRLERLRRDGLIPESDAIDARSRADAEAARVRALSAAEDQVAKEVAEVAPALLAKLNELESDRIGLEAALAAANAELREADLQIERLRVRAPAAGRIDSFTELRPGVWIAEGMVIGSIVPPQTGDVTAYFALADMPLIQPGQQANVWLEAAGREGRRRFPAVVRAVERDAAGEEFRVTLALAKTPARVEQGFPAVATVEVLRLSPFDALLRTAGMLPARETR